ncbi:hypothetical protein DXG03_006026 [Asterophora parasitica]|uniref:Fungal lipase-type domain-containing protein n=1 Tax=Asterophora parasitica TaxID=117018 RepID=A0A9P7KF27_9AGAR|nr:hypothetical protein DXG03_006026 [Asterophora parasitica]
MFASLPIILTLACLFLEGIRAGPLPPNLLQHRAAELSDNQLSSLVPFTQFAKAAYCAPNKIEGRSVLTDIQILRGPLDPELFPGAPEEVSVHTGFRDQHKIASETIFAEVQRLLAEKDSKKVITVGHSLGGALAMLSALSLQLRLPDDVLVSSTTFGAPRVGDADFANFFDSKVGLSSSRYNSSW